LIRRDPAAPIRIARFLCDENRREDAMNKNARYGNEADLSAIDTGRDAHIAAINRYDSEAWTAQFTEDGVQMPPNVPANIGKAMIGSWSHAMLSQFRVQFAFAVDEVRVVGDWAFERGGYTISLSPTEGATPMGDSGKYITIYERRPAEPWRIARDIWNSSNPAPGM
jgi:ketosteroid isomerase-like protein